MSAVPVGYKQTEVGVIPKDWEVKNLGALVRYTNGVAHEQNITDSGKFVVVNSKFISTEGGTRKYSDYCLCSALRGDVLMVMSDVPNGRAIAKCYSVECDNTYTVNQRICVLNPQGIDGKLLFYKLNRNSFYLAFDDGAKQTNLRKNEVLSCPLGIPQSETEQRAIATALSDVDALLAKLDQFIAKKRDLNQAAMQQLLNGQTRLPGFSGEWEVKRLGNVLRFQVGFPFGSEFFNQNGEGIRLIKNRDLKSDDQTFYYTGKFDDSFVVKNGDVLIGMDGDFLPCFWSKGIALLNQRVGRLVPSSRISKVFSYYMLIEPLKEIEYSTSATTVKHLSHGDIEAIECPLPPLSEQTAIATVLSDMDAELAALAARRDKTRALKQGMMQELLTGRIRLV